MRRALCLAGLGVSLVCGGVSAQTIPWSDSFESSSTQSAYQAWTGSQQSTLSFPEANHPHTGSNSAHQFATNPGGFSSTYTLSGNTSSGVTGGVESDVWVWDDNSVAQDANHVINAMLAFAGATGTTTPGFGTDYAELGLISGNTAPNGNTDWVIRVRSYDQAHGTTWFDTGVARTQGFMHLEIIADPNPSAGGDGLYHFLINGNDVTPNVAGGLSRNTGVGLEFDRIGSNSSTVQDFWYDDLNIAATPEPASLALLGLGMTGLVIRRRRAC